MFQFLSKSNFYRTDKCHAVTQSEPLFLKKIKNTIQ